jgi:hypothetical protein
MKPVTIKGKQYIPVSERIKFIADNFNYSIETDYQYFAERKMWVVQAILKIKKGDDWYSYSGLAQEIESGNYKEVNFTSALENAETSAVGRACAMAGIGIDGGIASADEVSKAINRAEVDEVGDEKRMYLISLLENTTYEERQKEQLAIKIDNIKFESDYEKAYTTLQANQIQDKDRIAMGLNYSQTDIKKTIKNLK